MTTVARIAAALFLVGACGSDRQPDKPKSGSATPSDAAPPSAIDAAAAAIVLPPAPPLPEVPRGLPAAPALPHVSPEAVALGELLFWDPRLSSTGAISCATCHEPHRGFSGDARLPNAAGKPNLRRAQALVNLAWAKDYGWDGRFTEFDELLDAHVQGQHGHDLAAAVARIATVPGYRAHFARVAGVLNASTGHRVAAEPSPDLATTAIHAFVVTRYEGDSDWDRAERASGGGNKVLRSGYALFTGKAQCSVCHAPPLYTDQSFHRLGLITVKDEGRGKLDATKRGAFKTPSLRGALHRPTLFHDGSATGLEAAIDYHLAGGVGQGADASIVDVKKIALSADERRDLVEFVEALSREPAPLKPPVMP